MFFFLLSCALGHAEDITLFVQPLQDPRDRRILQVQIFLYISLAHFLFARAEKVIQHRALRRRDADLLSNARSDPSHIHY